MRRVGVLVWGLLSACFHMNVYSTKYWGMGTKVSAGSRTGHFTGQFQGNLSCFFVHKKPQFPTMIDCDYTCSHHMLLRRPSPWAPAQKLDIDVSCVPFSLFLFFFGIPLAVT